MFHVFLFVNGKSGSETRQFWTVTMRAVELDANVVVTRIQLNMR
jgi:hypothetical protein